jgi:hypothetical protein
LGSFGNFRLVFTSTVLPSTSTQNEVSLVPGRLSNIEALVAAKSLLVGLGLVDGVADDDR